MSGKDVRKTGSAETKSRRERVSSECGNLQSNGSTKESHEVGNPKKRRKRKKQRKDNVSVTNTNKPKMQTDSNYPKELSSVDNLSCNWKKLCQENLVVNTGKSELKKSNTTLSGKMTTDRKRFPKTIVATNEIWFDGVDKELLEPVVSKSKNACTNKLVKDGSFSGLTSAIAMDCEMVGTGENGTESVLARVSIVNLMGNCIYDKYVKCTDFITDYRTAVSGIRPSDLEKGEQFSIVQKEVSDILNKRILVGHAVHNDLKVLFLTHPRRKIRDSSMYKPFRQVSAGNTPSLKTLSQKILGVTVQEGEHNSVQDAQAAMRLYTMHKIEWEKSIKKKQSKMQAAKNKTTSPTVSGKKNKKLTNSPNTRKFAQLKL